MSTKNVNPNPQQQTPHTDAEDEVTLRRRRLLKGAAAAPMVLTLFSGTALARTSTTVTVAENPEQAGLQSGTYEPLCIVDSDLTPVGPDSNKRFVGPGWHLGELPDPPETIDPLRTEAIFKHYQDACAGQGGVIVTASSATSLTH